jgi:hypothetical protein
MIRASNKVPSCELPSRRTRNGQAGYIDAPCPAIHLRKKRLFTSDRPYIRVLQPACHDLFIEEIERMLQVQEANYETRAQNRPARSGLKRLGGDAVDCCPVDHVGQLDEWMVQVDMLAQRMTLDIAVLENTAFSAHGSLRQICKEGPIILVIPANQTLAYLSEGRMDTGASLYFSAD